MLVIFSVESDVGLTSRHRHLRDAEASEEKNDAESRVGSESNDDEEKVRRDMGVYHRRHRSDTSDQFRRENPAHSTENITNKQHHPNLVKIKPIPPFVVNRKKRMHHEGTRTGIDRKQPT